MFENQPKSPCKFFDQSLKKFFLSNSIQKIIIWSKKILNSELVVLPVAVPSSPGRIFIWGHPTQTHTDLLCFFCSE